MCGALPPLSQYAFIALGSVKAQGQIYLYLYLYLATECFLITVVSIDILLLYD
jgi:hypothetical protein